MNVYVTQIYPHAGIAFPFTHHFQKHLSESISALVQPSESFIERYGREYDLIFRMSAKSGLVEPEIWGPTVFKRAKQVEFTIFLPFEVTGPLDAPALATALRRLLGSITSVLEGHGVNVSGLSARSDGIVHSILETPKMLQKAQ